MSEEVTQEAPNQEPAEGANTNREAKYRTERNQAREERDALASRLTELQSTEVQRLAAGLLAAPEDISLSGKELSDFLTPEGWVDREAVEAAAREVSEARPGLAKNAKATDFTQGSGGTVPVQLNWTDFLTI